MAIKQESSETERTERKGQVATELARFSETYGFPLTRDLLDAVTAKTKGATGSELPKKMFEVLKRDFPEIAIRWEIGYYKKKKYEMDDQGIENALKIAKQGGPNAYQKASRELAISATAAEMADYTERGVFFGLDSRQKALQIAGEKGVPKALAYIKTEAKRKPVTTYIEMIEYDGLKLAGGMKEGTVARTVAQTIGLSDDVLRTFPRAQRTEIQIHVKRAEQYEQRLARGEESEKNKQIVVGQLNIARRIAYDPTYEINEVAARKTYVAKK